MKGYLDRIGVLAAPTPSLATLRTLHRQHMRTVPFENIDISVGVPICLTHEDLYAKVISRNRGGFCYELNSLFAWLLTGIGFDVRLLSARVFDGQTFGPEFDHVALLVLLDRPYLADVGLGDSFLEPIPIDTTSKYSQGNDVYHLSCTGNEWTLLKDGKSFVGQAQYKFTLQAHEFPEFENMCLYHQTSPKSIFTSKMICSRATDSGRVTISNNHLIETSFGQRSMKGITGETELLDLLRARFGINLADFKPKRRFSWSPAH
ncbi:arylamine N-acetyltransferase [Telmatospirillum sp.]|uniref:arylamine N-acetyltransferase family protein n=1 Tax=Telmatospirillum sp. TaxID=2079197 RepID=UPI0028419833|nr:arylamine N-acetyltransferase [Telmatospirillum sp.]MDR3435614.1 arylamine N-acetyltransferase [Telmatospirillum sp.]